MSKHPQSGHTSGEVTPADDLDRDPGIKSSRGTTNSEDVDLLAGDTTVEGDVAEGTTAQGGVKVDAWGRTNK